MVDTHSYASKISVGPIDTQTNINPFPAQAPHSDTHMPVVNPPVLCLLSSSVFFFTSLSLWHSSVVYVHTGGPAETKGEKLTHPLLIRELYNQIIKGLTCLGGPKEKPPGWSSDSLTLTESCPPTVTEITTTSCSYQVWNDHFCSWLQCWSLTQWVYKMRQKSFKRSLKLLKKKKFQMLLDAFFFVLTSTTFNLDIICLKSFKEESVKSNNPLLKWFISWTLFSCCSSNSYAVIFSTMNHQDNLQKKRARAGSYSAFKLGFKIKKAFNWGWGRDGSVPAEVVKKITRMLGQKFSQVHRLSRRERSEEAL